MTRDRIKQGEGLSYLGAPTPLVPGICHDLLKTRLCLVRIVRAAIKGNNVLPVLRHLLGRQGNVGREAMASGPLPPGRTDPAAANFVKATSWVLGNLVTRESYDKRGDIVRLEGLYKFLGQDSPGHRSTRIGRNSVNKDVVLNTLKRQSTREAKNSAFLIEELAHRMEEKGETW